MKSLKSKIVGSRTVSRALGAREIEGQASEDKGEKGGTEPPLGCIPPVHFLCLTFTFLLSFSFVRQAGSRRLQRPRLTQSGPGREKGHVKNPQFPVSAAG